MVYESYELILEVNGNKFFTVYEKHITVSWRYTNADYYYYYHFKINEPYYA